MRAPGWTDGGEHDPGVVLLALLAWLALGLFLVRRLRAGRRRWRRPSVTEV